MQGELEQKSPLLTTAQGGQVLRLQQVLHVFLEWHIHCEGGESSRLSFPKACDLSTQAGLRGHGRAEGAQQGSHTPPSSSLFPLRSPQPSSLEILVVLPTSNTETLPPRQSAMCPVHSWRNRCTVRASDLPKSTEWGFGPGRGRRQRSKPGLLCSLDNEIQSLRQDLLSSTSHGSRKGGIG